MVTFYFFLSSPEVFFGYYHRHTTFNSNYVFILLFAVAISFACGILAVCQVVDIYSSILFIVKNNGEAALTNRPSIAREVSFLCKLPDNLIVAVSGQEHGERRLYNSPLLFINKITFRYRINRVSNRRKASCMLTLVCRFLHTFHYFTGKVSGIILGHSLNY
ncbi:hypothetical protein D3C75_993880 [compost metagenome]